jgi:SNF2 family DNA or RNA helicase
LTPSVIAYEGGKFVVSAPPHVLLKLKRVFAKADHLSLGSFELADTLDTARDLLWFTERYPMEFASPEAEQRLKSRAEQHRERESLVARILARSGTPQTFDLAEPPRDYQIEAAELVLANGGLLLADDMGLGKTLVSICVLSDARSRPALVVVPKAVQRQWRRQINRFAPKLRVHILRTGTPYDLSVTKRARGGSAQMSLPMNDGTAPDVIISTYNKLDGWAETLVGIGVKSVTFDEAQELRSGLESASGRPVKKNVAAKMIADNVAIRLALSGTPIHNYGGEMFNVMENVRPGALGTRGEFAREWGGVSIRDPKAFGSFLRAEGLMLRRTRAEVGRELPPLERAFHHIDCDREPIDDIEKSATSLARLIMSDGPELERGERMRAAEELSVLVRQATGIAKAPHVADFVKMVIESGESVVLSGWHRQVYSIWLERLAEFSPVMVTGSETDKQKDDAIQKFVNGRSKVIIISLRSAAGLDGLQYACRTVVHGELDYSPGVMEQFDTRVFRDGQKDPVISYYLVTDEGSDPIISTILKKKGEQLVGIRDPDAEFFEKLEAGDHVRQLAAAYLARRKGAAA